jgi:hypothetical protein
MARAGRGWRPVPLRRFWRVTRHSARLASRGTRRQLTLASERRVAELCMQLIDPLAQRGWDQVHRHRPAVPIILRWLGDLWPRPSWPRVVRIQAQGGPDAGQRVVSIGDHILVAVAR